MKLATQRNFIQRVAGLSLVAVLSTFHCVSHTPNIRDPHALVESINQEKDRHRILLAKSLNFQRHPGQHTVLSPVVGSRSNELARLHALAAHEPSLVSFARGIYYGEIPLSNGSSRIRPILDQMIPYANRDEASILARAAFRQHIARYAAFGITEYNVVSWESDYPAAGGITSVEDKESSTSTWHVRVRCSSTSLSDGQFFMPYYVTAVHEVMHLEEAPRGATLTQRLQSLNGLPIVIDELMPQLATIILLDEISKQVQHIQLEKVVPYSNTESIFSLNGSALQVYWDHHHAALGSIVNFYRDLVNRYGSYFGALASAESLHFLHTGQFE